MERGGGVAGVGVEQRVGEDAVRKDVVGCGEDGVLFDAAWTMQCVGRAAHHRFVGELAHHRVGS